ncbi:MAG: FecR domain-containing protein [Cytophagales bacterium]|nr:FecR domain-containing protein [Bernardetiaceae bacterium]MDW8206116.1 FecR domain-containing protein [Cytophagales bacterium]
MEKYRYSVEDLLVDASFQRYACGILGEEDVDISEIRQFWEDWCAQHPENQAAAQEAIELIKQLRQAESYAAVVPDIDKSWQQVLKRLQTTRQPQKPLVTIGWRTYLRYAAVVFILLSAIAASSYLYFLVPIEVYTQIGENRTVTLPDHSTVVLSGNSSLQYARYWGSNRPREVWLKGKAYFDVRHAISPDNRFVVHAGKARIEVLGTSFDVTNRNEATKVLLKTGKVKMEVEQMQPSSQATVSTVLMPGEEAELSEKSGIITKKVTDLEHSMNWVQQKFVFDNTPFEEVAKTIEENCGVKVTIRKQDLRTRRITAHLDAKNLDVFLTGVARLFDAKVKRKGDSVVFY